MSWETMTRDEIAACLNAYAGAYVDAHIRAQLRAINREKERLLREAVECSSWTFWPRLHLVEVQLWPLGPWTVGVASFWDPPASYRSWTDPGRRDDPTPRPSRTHFASHLLRRPRRRRAR